MILLLRGRGGHAGRLNAWSAHRGLEVTIDVFNVYVDDLLSYFPGTSDINCDLK